MIDRVLHERGVPAELLYGDDPGIPLGWAMMALRRGGLRPAVVRYLGQAQGYQKAPGCVIFDDDRGCDEPPGWGQRSAAAGRSLRGSRKVEDPASMVRVMCPECRIELDRGDWMCPRCGTPAEEEAHATGKEISTKGMVVMLVTFVGLPVLLFLLHLLVPGL